MVPSRLKSNLLFLHYLIIDLTSVPDLKSLWSVHFAWNLACSHVYGVLRENCFGNYFTEVFWNHYSICKLNIYIHSVRAKRSWRSRFIKVVVFNLIKKPNFGFCVGVLSLLMHVSLLFDDCISGTFQSICIEILHLQASMRVPFDFIDKFLFALLHSYCYVIRLL